VRRRRRIEILPFPAFFPRNIDLLTPLTLQERLDPELELFYCRGHVSVPLREATGGREVKTELGIEIKASSIHRGRTEIVYGLRRPTGYEPLTQREILEDVVANTSIEEVPEVVLRDRGVIEDIPRGLEDIEVFQGHDEVFYMQRGVGNRYRSLRRMLQLPLANPYRIARELLLLHQVVKPWDKVFKRLGRSILKTEWVGVGSDRELKVGWMELETYTYDIQRSLCENKWWQDTAVPHPISDRIDSRIIKAQIYVLDKLDKLIAI